MSLIWFHRFLIACAIVFCFAFAAWEVKAAMGGSDGAWLLAAVFVVLGVLLGFYLRNLRRMLNLPAERR